MVDLTISVDRGRGDAATTGEALSVALALVPADAAQASSYRMAPARVELPAITTPAGKQSAATRRPARGAGPTSSSTTTGSR